MAVAARVSVQGTEAVVAMLRRLAPAKNQEIARRALKILAFEVQRVATREEILPGGKGPPDPHRLTSRTGTLRRSIAVDQSSLPFSVSVGTDLVYGAVHELGIPPFPPRPFLQPAIDKVSPTIAEVFRREWEKEARA